MTDKHTPGPWHVDTDALNVSVRDADACTIARVEPRAVGAAPSQADAARLIAAAPELLAALQAAENMLETIRAERYLDNAAWDAIDATVDAIRAALAKADVD